MRALALDVGSKTIGLAVTDGAGIAAHALKVHRREGTQKDAMSILDIIKEYEVTSVVVGLPYTLSGDVGHRAKRVRVFSDALKEVCEPSVRFFEWDERFSTSAVEKILIKSNVSREKRKKIIDSSAAVYILQGWMESRTSE